MLIKGMQITFQQVDALTPQDFRDLETLTENWFNGFYNTSSTNVRERRKLRNSGSVSPNNVFARRDLQGSPSVRNMESTVTIQLQKTDPVAVTNTITYDQTLKYVSVGDNPSGPEYYAVLPYRNVVANGQYGRLLRDQLTPFASVGFPIPVPLLPNQTTPDTGDNTETSDNGDSLSLGAIIGIAVGGVVVLGAVLGGGYHYMQSPPPPPTKAKTPRPLSVGNPQPAEYMSGNNLSYPAGEMRQSNGFQETTVVSGNTSMATAVSPSPRRSTVEPVVVEPEIGVSNSVASYDGKRCVCNVRCRWWLRL